MSDRVLGDAVGVAVYAGQHRLGVYAHRGAEIFPHDPEQCVVIQRHRLRIVRAADHDSQKHLAVGRAAGKETRIPKTTQDARPRSTGHQEAKTIRGTSDGFRLVSQRDHRQSGGANGAQRISQHRIERLH